MKELENGDRRKKPLEIAQEAGHKDVAQLLRLHIPQARHSGGSKSRFLASIRNKLGVQGGYREQTLLLLKGQRVIEWLRELKEI